jgi:hypothetical protein
MKAILKYVIITLIFIFIFTVVKSKTHNPYSYLICNRQNCPTTQGFCNKDNVCQCYEGYTTVDDPRYGKYKCNYPLKQQMTAFLLEFILGFGVGHFYLGNYEIGIPKMFFSFLTSFFVCFFPIFSLAIKSVKLKRMVPYLQFIFGLVYGAWQIIDGVLIGINYYRDANGFKMQEW